MKNNRIFRGFVAAGLVFSMIFGTFSVSFADEAVVSEADSMEATTEMSIEDKINDMYANIDSEAIRNMYIDQTKYYITNGSNYVKCKISKTADIYDAPYFTPTSLTIRANDIDMKDYYEFSRTSDFTDRNRVGVELLYSLCQIAKNDTASMNDEQKMQYVMSFVSAYMTYNYEYANAITSDQSVPTFFEKLSTKSGVCSDFAQLFTIIGQYIGLDTRTVVGYYSGVGHAWNAVTINGARYNIEPIHGSFIEGANAARYQEKVKTDDYETNLRLLWSVE